MENGKSVHNEAQQCRTCKTLSLSPLDKYGRDGEAADARHPVDPVPPALRSRNFGRVARLFIAIPLRSGSL